jgi:hypothetical protein
MNRSERAALAARIDEETRAVPGVADVYRAANNVLAKIVDAGARLLGVGDEDAPIVTVHSSAGQLTVHLAIGVHASGSAVDTVRRVHRRVDDLLAAAGETDATVEITVVHVDDSDPRDATSA